MALEAPSGEFGFTRLEKVLFGPGRIGAIGEELDLRGLSRALIATSQSLGRSPLLGKLSAALGARCAGVYDRCAQHAPASTVRALAAEIERVNADAVISFGGGSAIDSTKVAIASVINGRDMILEARELDLNSAATRASGARELLHIAVPTTLSAGEYTSGGGVTDEATRKKRGVFDPRIQARVIVHDPEMTEATPDWLWVSTGMRALDHAVESIYSVRHQPFVDALAAKAIRLLTGHLRPSISAQGEERIAHRGECQLAAWFSLFGGVNAVLGVSHALSHQIGPQWNVPHGVTSCLTLPHGMRFMAGIAPERFGPIAEALSIAFDEARPSGAAQACAERIAEFIAGFDVPHSLSELGVAESEVGVIAKAAHHEIERFGSVGRAVTDGEVLTLLRAVHRGE